MFTYIKLSIKVKKVKKWEIISCPQTYTVIVLMYWRLVSIAHHCRWVIWTGSFTKNKIHYSAPYQAGKRAYQK